MDLTVGVGDGPGFFRKRRGGQNHVSVVCRFSDKDILHHEVRQFRQRVTRMFNVGVRHRGVFTKDIHAVNIAVMNCIHNLGDGQSLFGQQRFVDCISGEVTRPDFSETRPDAIVGDGLHIRQEHRD